MREFTRDEGPRRASRGWGRSKPLSCNACSTQNIPLPCGADLAASITVRIASTADSAAINSSFDNFAKSRAIGILHEWVARENNRIATIARYTRGTRDDFRPDSDVDVLIQLRQGETMSLEKFIDMRDELIAMFGREVDLVEKPLLRNPYRRDEILRTREVLYAA